MGNQDGTHRVALIAWRHFMIFLDDLMMIRNWIVLCLLVLCLNACLGGAGGAAGSSSGSSGSSTNVTKPTVTLSLVSSLPATDTNVASTVIFGTPIYAVAKVLDAAGVPVSGAVVSFSSDDMMVTFNPVSATALTVADGTAVIRLESASLSASGATSIVATASVASGASGEVSAITSLPKGIAVNAANVTLGAINFGQSSISAYGSSEVSVPVLVGGVSTTLPISVMFSSSCASSGKATLTNPVTAIGGVATATYKDNNCASGNDTIMASVTGSQSSAVIAVGVPAATNIRFLSSTPSVIGIRGGGSSLPQSASLIFQVVDNTNNGKSGVVVDFGLLMSNPSSGIVLSPTSAVSDINGEVTVSIVSGTIPTPVSVVAKVHDNPSIISQSNTLTITTGLPAQNFFSLSVQAHNIEGWIYDGITSTLTVTASDRLGNPVTDGTAVSFIAEGGQVIPPSCLTVGGACSVNFKSSEYRPIGETTVMNPLGAVAALRADGSPIVDESGNPIFVSAGRATVLAYAVGEESFLDANANNVYDAGETFYDLGDVFIDSNENGAWDSNPTQPGLREQFLNFGLVNSPVACLTRNVGSGTAPLPANYDNAPGMENSCDGVWGKHHVRRSTVIVMSGSFARLAQRTFAMGGACRRNFPVQMMDGNGNPMPAGTVVTVESNTVSYTDSVHLSLMPSTVMVVGTPVLGSKKAGGTTLEIQVENGTDCTGVGVVTSGSANLVIKTPQNMTTTIPVSITP